MCLLRFCVATNKTIMRKTFLFLATLFIFAGNARAANASVFINEIAWMGTTVSSSNEWIELANDGSSAVSLTGWVLSIEGKKDIVLSGNISANGFYLIERTDDTTVPGIAADLIASFGTGIPNTGAILSLKNAGAVVDRVDGSQEWKIGGVLAGDNTTKETAQRGASGWFTGNPTPRAVNGQPAEVATPSNPANTNTTLASAVLPTNNSSFPVEPQIFTDAGQSVRTVPVGATIIFSGRVWGLKKEPIENARMVWAFGDGASADGASVSHIYYYPGEYTAVLDAASGFYAASDRVRVTAVVPSLTLRTGGDSARSFVAIENSGNTELDLSGWQISSQEKNFILPKNTLIGARKILTVPSEISGFSAPATSIVSLSFPNGSSVPLLQNPTNGELITSQNEKTETVKSEMSVRGRASRAPTQTASALAALDETSNPLVPVAQESSLWPWYTGIALLGALAALAVRFGRRTEKSATFTADDFEIIEKKE